MIAMADNQSHGPSHANMIGCRGHAARAIPHRTEAGDAVFPVEPSAEAGRPTAKLVSQLSSTNSGQAKHKGIRSE